MGTNIELESLYDEEAKTVEYGGIDRVTEVFDRAKPTIYKDIVDGIVPAGIKIGKRATVWPMHELYAVLTARAAKFDAAGIRLLVRHMRLARLTGNRIDVKKWIAVHRRLQRLTPPEVLALRRKGLPG